MTESYPVPSPCPNCAGRGYIRESFFPVVRPGAAPVLLARCSNCSLRLFMMPDGSDPEPKALPRALPRVCARWIVPAGSAVIAPAGTEVFRHPRALRWTEWPPRFRPDRLLVWNSLEERADTKEALAEIRSVLPPGGVLAVVSPNAAAFPARLFGGGSLWEPQRQRVLFTPVLLASLLREAGFRNGKLRYSPAGLRMRAEAAAP